MTPVDRNDHNNDNDDDDDDLWLIFPPAPAHDLYPGAGAQRLSQLHLITTRCHKNIGIGQLSADVRNVPVMQLTLSLTLSVRLEVRTLAGSQTGEESYHHTQSLDTTITI